MDVTGRRSVLLHPGLLASGATLLIAAFVSGLLYWQTLFYQRSNLSQWLVARGWHRRPVGVALDRTGALLVADDVGSAVWRVTAGSATAAAGVPTR